MVSRGQVQGVERGGGGCRGHRRDPWEAETSQHLDAWTLGHLTTVPMLGMAFILAPPASQGAIFKLPFPLRKVEAASR